MPRRLTAAVNLRREFAEELLRTPSPLHLSNGEEGDHPFVANHTKGLPHDETGEVDRSAYETLLRALATRNPRDFEAVPLGPAGNRPLVNPQAGLAFDLEGPDAQSVTMPPAPRIDGARNSAEMVELYWMALLRDLPFADYSEETVGEAAAELSGLSDYRAPRRGGEVTPELLFRGDTPGDLRGPYVSQFLLQDITYGTLHIPQLHASAPPGVDHLTGFDEWLAVQNAKEFPAQDPNELPRKYIRTPRDLATYVHFDALYQAYLNACLILLASGAPEDADNPYRHSGNQVGFGTYGGPKILSLVTEVATRALQAVWYQKWFVHRRLRPEEFGGRIHTHLSGVREYPMIDREVLESNALKLVAEQSGGYLLPQAFPEGSPNHPAYGSGHATVAGACVTVLKAWYDESFPIADPVVPDAEGRRLLPYEGEDRDALTIGGELNKVAANISIARNMAGVHWRTDYSESVRLGEEVAIGILGEHLRATNEEAALSLTRFDGTRITITG